MPSAPPRWSKAEDRVLFNSGGGATRDELLRELPGRTWQAIKSRCRSLGIDVWQGTWTMARIIRETKYNWKQVLRAKKALGQKWNRAKPRAQRADGKGGTRYIISDDQYEAIVEFLGEGKDLTHVSRYGHPTVRWSRDHDCCVVCGTDGTEPHQRHASRGECMGCQGKRRHRERMKQRRENPDDPKVLAQLKHDREQKAKWARENRHKQNDYKKRRRLTDPAFRQKDTERQRARRRRLKEKANASVSELGGGPGREVPAQRSDASRHLGAEGAAVGDPVE